MCQRLSKHRPVMPRRAFGGLDPQLPISKLPLERAEQHRNVRGCRARLFEAQRAEFASPPDISSSAGYRLSCASMTTGERAGGLLLVTFLGRQEK